MKENKSFKAFRSELKESDYKEVLTGYPNRGMDQDGALKFDSAMIPKINGVLNAISRSTFQSPNEAFIAIRVRLNALMLDFPWTPHLWNNNATGVVTTTVTRFGRVDGVDAITGAVRFDGKANGYDGFVEFTLGANMENTPEGFWRVNASLSPVLPVVVANEETEVAEGHTAKLKRVQGAKYDAQQRGDYKKHSRLAGVAGDLQNKVDDAQARRGGASPEAVKQDIPQNEMGKVTQKSSTLHSRRQNAIRKFNSRAMMGNFKPKKTG